MGRAQPHEVTDRAQRYRARRRLVPAGQPCVYCGQPRARDVDHIDGDETNQARQNLAPCCVSCNTSKGAAFARAGLGRRTRQFNPRKKTAATGAGNLAQWVMAVLSIKGRGPWPIEKAVEIIHATPPEDRSAYAQEIWRRRHAWQTPARRGRKAAEDDEIPF